MPPSITRRRLRQFKFGKHDATYLLAGATVGQFDKMLRIVRDRVAADDPSGAIVDGFSYAAATWPKVNPSDLWSYILPNAFSDPYNHPASNHGKDFAQSWKRTAGFALERTFLEHYRGILGKNGVTIEMPHKARKRELLAGLGLGNQVDPDKADLLLIGQKPDGTEQCFGVAHVKASFAERRTDDVPLSEALLNRGFYSPLLTMDCKGSPSPTPVNRGELGDVLDTEGDNRGQKRLDFERDRRFSACFSFNRNTKPTPLGQDAAARVYVCDFKDADDEFSRQVTAHWKQRRGVR
ncbi:MAG: hypothetical protein R2694_11505 [Ilumatobacteraceae bacterium]